MSRFQKYVRATSEQLAIAFQKIRSVNSDPGVKGSGNENAVAQFVEQHCPVRFVHKRAQVIDSIDNISDELDVVASNEYQPFCEAPDGVLLVEGVAFVIQVKAILTRDEIRRTVENCTSFKRLKPWFGQGDIVYREFYQLRPHWQAPYVCFCYSSQLKDQTVLEELEASSLNVDPDLQMDALFVLDRGWSVMNFRHGSPRFTNSVGQQIISWGLTETSDQTLLEMLSFLHLTTPRITRINSPLQAYVEKLQSAKRSGLFKYAE